MARGAPWAGLYELSPQDVLLEGWVCQDGQPRRVVRIQADLRKLEKEVARLEQRVADLETLQAKLTAELADPATYAQGAKVQQLNAELQATTEALQTATNDWEKAAQKLSEEKK